MATIHGMRRDTDLSLFALNDRFMKLVPEKDSAASEAQTGLPLDDPEGPGQPKGKDGTQYGRVTICCSPHPTPTAAAATQGSGPPSIHGTGCGKRLGGTTHLY